MKIFRNALAILLILSTVLAVLTFSAAAAGTTAYYTTKTRNTALLLTWSTFGSVLDVPSEIDDLRIDEIAPSCFQYREVSELNIPVGIEILGDFAFYSLSDVTDITIPRSVAKIGKSCFGECTPLETIYIPNTVTEIGENALWGCPELTIRCYAGSAAYNYAVENNVAYVILDEDCLHSSTRTETEYAPTCSEKGRDCVYCAYCGRVMEFVDTDPISHSFTDWDVRSTVERYRECTACGRAEYQYCRDYVWNNPFSDVAVDAWYADSVGFTNYNSIIKGMSRDTFDPEASMTRYMFVTLVGRICGVKEDDFTECRFDDVPSGQWYTSYVEWAARNNIVNGISGNKYGGERDITREQMATLLYRFADYLSIDLSGPSGSEYMPFSDSSEVSEYAKEALSWAIHVGMINGVGNNLLLPGGTARRCEVAVLTERFINKFIPEQRLTGDYKYVVVLGVDGMGGLCGLTDTPNMDKMFDGKAYTYHAEADYITVSAQNWGAILHGVTSYEHGYTNETIGLYEFPDDSSFPSFLKLAAINNPAADHAIFATWSPINSGLVENGYGIDKFNSSNGMDDALVTSVKNYLSSKTPEVLFVAFNDPDHYGHDYGWKSDEFYASITTIDGYIGDIYDIYEDKGILDETLFIVTADHGGKGGSHGGRTSEEIYVFLGVSGKTVSEISLDNYNNRDVAAIVLDALKINRPSNYLARLPENLYKTEI